jgi:pectinesterase
MPSSLTRRALRSLPWSVIAALATVACSSDQTTDDDGGSSGATAGVAGVSGTSGSAGTAAGASSGGAGAAGASTGGTTGGTGAAGASSGGAGSAGIAGGGGSDAVGGAAGTTAIGGASGAAGSTAGDAGSAGTSGGSEAGGTAGNAGSSAGSAGSSGAGGPVEGAFTGTPTRPQLTADQATNHGSVLQYLARGGAVTAPTVDNWDPTAGVGDVASFTATYTVGTSGGTHTTVAAAVNAAVSAGGTNRVYIRVLAGTYREVVCVPSTAPPITLYSTNTNPADTVIVYGHLSGHTVDSVVNACAVPSGETYGTSGSSTFAVFGSQFQAKNLTFSNDGDESSVSSGTQGVALLTKADKLVFENVTLLGNQDTLLVGTTNVATIQRAYFKGCTIEGDVDFICGRGTAVFDGGEIRQATDRRNNGNIVAPSTDARSWYGFLITGASFTAEAGVQAGGVTLGRAWDESQVDEETYATNVATGVYPNGETLIRNSTLGSHINGTTPWAAAATTGRAFSSTDGEFPRNRLYEFENTGP